MIVILVTLLVVLLLREFKAAIKAEGLNRIKTNKARWRTALAHLDKPQKNVAKAFHEPRMSFISSIHDLQPSLT